MIMMRFHDIEDDVKVDCDVYEGAKDCERKYELKRENHFKVVIFPHAEVDVHTEVKETRQGARGSFICCDDSDPM
jgi:hypothetical protein